MNRRITLVLVIALVVSLSGCSVLLGGDDGPASTPTPETPAGPDGTVEPTVTPTDGGSNTDGSTATPSPTPAPDSGETFDAAQLNADHVGALESAGSFTTESSLVIRNESQRQYINGSYAVERGGPAMNAANITFVLDGEVSDLPTVTRYTEGDTTYERQVQRTDSGTETSYREGSEPYSDDDPQPVNTTVAYSLGGIARDVIDSSTWTRAGDSQLEGEDVTQYDTSGEDFGVERVAAADGTSTFAVDEDGVVRYVAYRFVANVGGEPTEYVYEAAYTGIGETTVEEPQWTDEA